VNLRTRLALLLALLAGLSASAVGVAGFRVTASSFRGEIEQSLDDYADHLTAEPADAVRSCSTARRRPGPSGDADGGPGARSRGGGPPSGALVQCLDTTGAVTLSPRLFDLPVGDDDRKILTAKLGTRRSSTVDVDGRRYLMETVAVKDGAIQIARELSENTKVLNSLVRRFLVLVAAATGLAGLAGLLVARRTARPLAELTATAEDIAARGRLDVPLPVPRHNDETGRLTRAFSTMVDALRTSKQQQTQLVHDAGHELRTPLTSLRTNIGVLHRHPDMAADKRTAVVDDLHAELAELTELVDELVALASDSDPNDPIETVALDTLVRDVGDRWQRRTTREVTFRTIDERGTSVSVSDDTFDVLGRSRLLARAASNLVSNAAKFSPVGLPIELTLTRSVDAVELVVRDHGPGIPAEDLAKIFDRFYRSTVHRSHPGSGLGLAIVAQVAAEHGGTVRAQNMSDGGAQFVVHLPIVS
jgi:two-component system, OmpR family, sensor histidine kinase MprB